MAEHSVPHFHNNAGLATIAVGSKEFMCIGAKPPFDHPHVYLDMGTEAEIICPYCSTLYRFDAALKPGHSTPEDAAFAHDEAA